MKNEYRFAIVLNQSQRDYLNEQAERYGMSKATYFRQLLIKDMQNTQRIEMYAYQGEHPFSF